MAHNAGSSLSLGYLRSYSLLEMPPDEFPQYVDGQVASVSVHHFLTPYLEPVQIPIAAASMMADAIAIGTAHLLPESAIVRNLLESRKDFNVRITGVALRSYFLMGEQAACWSQEAPSLVMDKREMGGPTVAGLSRISICTSEGTSFSGGASKMVGVVR